jgi:hypothetical protein
MELLYPYVDIIVVVFYLGFFTFAIAAIYGNRRRTLRRAFVVLFFVGLLFFNTIAPHALLPYVDWHKFSSPRPQEFEGTEMRLVDEHGNEFDYPSKATLARGHADLSAIQSGIIEGRFSEARSEAIAAHLIREADAYRDGYNTDPRRFIRYPPHGFKEFTLADAGEFVAIRIYRGRVRTSADGTEITERESELLVEITPSANRTEWTANATAPAMAVAAGGVP